MSTIRLQLPSKEINFDTPKRSKFLKDGLNSTSKENILGRGSFGTVIKAVYKGQQVAVKVLNSLSESKIKTIKSESNILGWKHENIIQILKIINEPEYGLIIMERFPGQCLQFLLNKTRISLFHRICIAQDVINALCFCHSKNLIHLDVKPQNILIAYHEEINLENFMEKKSYLCKLCDFGSSVLLKDAENFNSNQGTVRYMCPEALKNEPVTPSADIFSLGITMWQLETSLHPYSFIERNEIVAYRVIKENLRPDFVKFEHLKKFLSPSKHIDCICRHYSPEKSNQTTVDIKNILHHKSENLKALTPSKLTPSKLTPTKLTPSKLTPTKLTPKRATLMNLNRNISPNVKSKSPKISTNNNLSSQKVVNLVQKNEIEINISQVSSGSGESLSGDEEHLEPPIKKYFQRNSSRYSNLVVQRKIGNLYTILYKKCWHADPLQRPSLECVKAELETFLNCSEM